MWPQISAIAKAQFRTSRNHLPRTTWGAVLTGILMSLWYALYATAAVYLAWKLPSVPLSNLASWLPAGLLGVFFFWQLIPLFTLSSGWSLQLNKLQVYPIRPRTLFALEVILRVTSAPEMIILLLGALAGLLRHPSVSPIAPFFLLLFVPMNMFVQLGVRDLILHAFERNRFRELFTVLIVGVAVVPQLLLRTGSGRRLLPYFLGLAKHHATPWSELAALSLGYGKILDFVFFVLWSTIAFGFGRWMFAKSVATEDTVTRSPAMATQRPKETGLSFSRWPSKFFKDPLAALIQKELQSLLRMPRFRVLFGMSCLLGIVVFVPASLNNHDPAARFMQSNLIPVVNVYGLLLLSDTLLLNAFGLDRQAAQVYFVTPVALSSVLISKNVTAIVFVVLQSATILLIAAFVRTAVTPMSVLSGVLASAVVTVYLLATGNYTSLAMPRPTDPKQTFKKQAGAKMQIWLLGCTLGLFGLMGLAFLARYAFQSDWIFVTVLCGELLVGLIVYRFGMESAVQRGWRDRELIVQSLSRSASPVSLG